MASVSVRKTFVVLNSRARDIKFIQQRALHMSLSLKGQDIKSIENDKETSSDTDEFRVYQIEGLKRTSSVRRAERWSKRVPPPRYCSMSTEQDWTDVWPTASTFKWSAVPFPVRQGYVENSSENEGVIPSKYANLELMKGPNFLHLTPAHVQKHCKAIKHFCTKWPEGLETDEQCQKHFPVESVTSDYIYAGPSLTDDRARVASIKFKLSDLKLDYHARDKFVRLVGDRYNPETDDVFFESNRPRIHTSEWAQYSTPGLFFFCESRRDYLCPLKSQNLEYVKFLLTAVYFESWKNESWEQGKQLSDMETYVWNHNKSHKTCMSLLASIQAKDKTTEGELGKLSYLPENEVDTSVICGLPEVQQYKVAVETLFNVGENMETLNTYKMAVEKLLNFKSDV